MTTTAILVHPDRGPATVQLTLDRARIHHVHGRAGQPSHTRTETLDDAGAARRQFETRIFRLISKGYRVGHHHAGLIDAIAESPNDSSSYQVYADWLAERGDPRARLIERTELPQTSADLVDLLVPHRWQFTRRDWKDYDVIWWMGFVHTVCLRRYWGWWSPSRDAEPDGDRLVVRNRWARQLLLTIRRHPSGRFLRWVQEEYHVARGEWSSRTFGVEFDFDVEPWVVRLVPNRVRDVNLNTATAGVLGMLPGVGTVLAQRILQRREVLGAFESMDQLGEVPGIGPATIARLRDLVMV